MATQDIMDLLSEDLIFFHVKAKDRAELLNSLSDILLHKGYVKTTFARKLLERESKYPTGLPTAGIKVAIPHTDSDQVLKGCILIAILDRPVDFKEMGNGINDVGVQIVFLLAVNDTKNQVGLLKKVMSIMLEESVIQGIWESKDPASVISILRNKFKEQN